MPSPPKTINIITNTINGHGLQRDAELVFALLDKMGHRPRLIHYESNYSGINYSAHTNIFMEVLVADMLNFSGNNIFIPNSEWFRIENGDEAYLPRINQVWCKTHDCYNIWNRKLNGRCVYTGFEGADYYNSSISQKEIRFLHLAGNSGTKNTEAVVDAWRQYKLPYPIDIVILNPAIRTLCVGVPNVTYHQRIAESHVQYFVNNAWFHLLPSQYEGYGQAIHEALSCGGLVLTTDAPPMNEFSGIPSVLRIPSSGTYIKSLATCHYVSPAGVRDAVERAVALTPENRAALSLEARNAFLTERDAFRQIFTELMR